MQRSLASVWAAISICAGGTASLVITSEACAQAPLLDPGWQIYAGGQPGGVNSGFIAHTFGPGQYGYQPAPYPETVYATPGYSAPRFVAPNYSGRARYQTAPTQPPAYQPAPQYYAIAPAPQPRGYQQPAPQYYAAAPAPQGRGIQAPVFFQQPAPQQYYAPPPQQPAVYQRVPQPAAYQSPPQYDQPPPLFPQLFARSDWSPGYAPSSIGDMARPMVDPKFDRQVVDYPTGQPPGTLVIDTPHYFLYLVMEGGKALRYGIGVGRPGFAWAGIKEVSAMREWPDWRPPDDMLRRRPDLPRFMPGGPENPLGARAIYLGSTLYRIHGSNEPWTIGMQVSSGCIRLRNEDVIDLYGRVKVGTKVIVI
jgi:lipoprotein-anchoring transpeptidase ErfK/SrfK